MKNEQALKLNLLEFEHHNSRILVEYEVFGNWHTDYIYYDRLIPFFERSGIKLKSEGTNIYLTKFDNDDISRIPQDVLKDSITDYLWDDLKIDILVENKYLKERLAKANEAIEVIADILKLRR